MNRGYGNYSHQATYGSRYPSTLPSSVTTWKWPKDTLYGDEKHDYFHAAPTATGPVTDIPPYRDVPDQSERPNNKTTRKSTPNVISDLKDKMSWATYKLQAEGEDLSKLTELAKFIGEVAVAITSVLEMQSYSYEEYSR